MNTDEIFNLWLNLSMPEKDEFLAKVAIWLETFGRFIVPSNPDELDEFSESIIKENSEAFNTDSPIFLFTKSDIEKLSSSLNVDNLKDISDNDFNVRVKFGEEKQIINLGRNYFEFNINNGKFKITNKMIAGQTTTKWLSDMNNDFKYAFLSIICNKLKSL